MEASLYRWTIHVAWCVGLVLLAGPATMRPKDQAASAFALAASNSVGAMNPESPSAASLVIAAEVTAELTHEHDGVDGHGIRLRP
jgi:hypothetical protein